MGETLQQSLSPVFWPSPLTDTWKGHHPRSHPLANYSSLSHLCFSPFKAQLWLITQLNSVVVVNLPPPLLLQLPLSSPSSPPPPLLPFNFPFPPLLHPFLFPIHLSENNDQFPICPASLVLRAFRGHCVRSDEAWSVHYPP